MGSRVIRIVGAPASGKSTVRRALAQHLGLPSFSIDDERLRLMGPDDVWPANDALAWRRLRAAIDANPAAIVETSGLSPRDQWLFDGIERFTVLVVADPWVRRWRLQARVASRHPLARTAHYVQRCWELGEPVGVTPHAIWRGDAPADVGELAERIRSWLESTAAAPA